jgi:rhodanese-related sulfurtransferase
MEKGFLNISVLGGGVAGWKKAGFPMEKAGGHPEEE